MDYGTKAYLIESFQDDYLLEDYLLEGFPGVEFVKRNLTDFKEYVKTKDINILKKLTSRLPDKSLDEIQQKMKKNGIQIKDSKIKTDDPAKAEIVKIAMNVKAVGEKMSKDIKDKDKKAQLEETLQNIDKSISIVAKISLKILVTGLFLAIVSLILDSTSLAEFAGTIIGATLGFDINFFILIYLLKLGVKIAIA
jgi:hypothetical protein